MERIRIEAVGLHTVLLRYYKEGKESRGKRKKKQKTEKEKNPIYQLAGSCGNLACMWNLGRISITSLRSFTGPGLGSCC